MAAKDIFAIWCMVIMMIALTLLVAALIWVVVDAIKRGKE